MGLHQVALHHVGAVACAACVRNMASLLGSLFDVHLIAPVQSFDFSATAQDPCFAAALK